jgi:DNA-directed RNA polymerase
MRALRHGYGLYPDLRYLMEGPFDRAIVKRPVMSFFYGSEAGGFTKKRRWQKKATGVLDNAKRRGRSVAYGMTEQVCEVLKERGKATTGAQRLARAICEAIEGMVPRASEVRDYLQQLAELCANENKPLRWTTPHGLPVHNRYHKYETEIIRTPLKKGAADALS